MCMCVCVMCKLHRSCHMLYVIYMDKHLKHPQGPVGLSFASIFLLLLALGILRVYLPAGCSPAHIMMQRVVITQQARSYVHTACGCRRAVSALLAQFEVKVRQKLQLFVFSTVWVSCHQHFCSRSFGHAELFEVVITQQNELFEANFHRRKHAEVFLVKLVAERAKETTQLVLTRIIFESGWRCSCSCACSCSSGCAYSCSCGCTYSCSCGCAYSCAYS